MAWNRDLISYSLLQALISILERAQIDRSLGALITSCHSEWTSAPIWSSTELALLHVQDPISKAFFVLGHLMRIPKNHYVSRNLIWVTSSTSINVAEEMPEHGEDMKTLAKLALGS